MQLLAPSHARAARECGKPTQSNRGDRLNRPDARDRQITELRERLSRLSEASLRINQSLDFDNVLQGVLDSARSLTGARYGIINLFNDAGVVEDFLASGITADEED